MKNLLQESYESYYWLGFIFADGHISKNNRLKVCLNNLDEEHLQKLSKFLGNIKIRKYKNNVELSIMDTKNIGLLKEKYEISNKKTYNPVNLKAIKYKRKMIALIIGFIDGDGHITNVYKRKDFSLTIKCHSSWIDILNIFSELLVGKKTARINKKGYSYFSITNSITLKKIKRIALLMKLPILKRKWDKINLNFISRQETSKITTKKISKLLANGYSQKEIANILGLSKSAISLQIKRNNIMNKINIKVGGTDV